MKYYHSTDTMENWKFSYHLATAIRERWKSDKIFNNMSSLLSESAARTGVLVLLSISVQWLMVEAKVQ